MKIFLTGGTGFIGKEVVGRLQQTEHEVVCLVRDMGRAQFLEECDVTLVQGDVTERASIIRGMQGCDWVINLANVYSLWEPDRDVYTQVNIEGTRNVMEAALETGVAKVLHVSTMAVYGKPVDCPFTEDSPVGPERFSDYARTKYQGDLLAWRLYQDQRLPLVVVYPGAVLGEGDVKSTGTFIRNVADGKIPYLTFPNTPTTYVHVQDVVEVIVRALEQEGNLGEKFFAGKYQATLADIARMVNRICGRPAPRRTMPDWLIYASAHCLTGLADLTGRPPLLNLSIDAARTTGSGFQADGSKAERVLGIRYTPLETAIREQLAALHARPHA